MTWLWSAAEQSETVILHVSVPRGRVAFVDGGAEPELWGRTYIGAPGVERQAVADFVATAHASAAQVADGETLTVLGEGLLAQLIREVRSGPSTATPDVLIDTTGSPERISRAVSALPRLGRLILAAPPRLADIDLATYRDIHVRGLSIVGIPWRAGSPPGAGARASVDAILDQVTPAVPGRRSPRSPLYVLRSPESA